MKMQRKHGALGSTLFEVVIIVIIVGVLAVMYLPGLLHQKPGKRPRINCISNLKQMGIGFRLYASDNGGRLPDFDLVQEAWTYFQSAGQDLSSPRVLICSRDLARWNGKGSALDFDHPGSDRSFSHPSNRNATLSYFYGLGADESRPNLLVAGDRNLSTNGTILRGLLLASTNRPPRWTDGIHKGAGNVLLADGSAHQTSDVRFAEFLRGATNESQRLVLP